ncbi:outer membrane protein transport protein [Acinetobacter bohemicus]|uniref:OmpP1/FadL family transporter n=1 Tax=Acinetobacter TaxID=469 RepID=UPI00209AB3FF|nr:MULTISPECIES: outer membrane protein transport protein [Acinetobacter]MCO8041936.1 outer membrane protein transport protein [Acinetobacter sp. S4400-12]MCO8044507.1 outer membrane protein transport protein [Acinetobacter sp. S4397-1]MCU7224599.1 outer membrane protein transport protein [Acinetobacter bohemicus]
MKLKPISIAILLSTLPTSVVFAAGLDRSGQSISAFLQPGNYAEAGISILDPEVKGKDTNGNKTGDMAGDYYFPNAALKIQATDHFSVGLIYDQPFGADAEYSGNNRFVENPPVPFQGGTSVTVDTQNLNLLFGYQPNENWNLYAGAVYQTVDGTVLLRGETYSAFNGYDFRTGEDESVGWLAGVAYQIPEIALKASVTYRAEIEHKMNASENFGSTAIQDNPLNPVISMITRTNSETKLTTPQSLNIDFQTGIMTNTVAFANLRWVDWSKFKVQPYQFGKLSQYLGQNNLVPNKPNGFNLIDYKEDQISATVGVGRKFTDHWAANVSVGWDSGAGNPVTTLGPTDGYWNVGTGVRFSPATNYFIGAGVKYFWLGDADAVTGAHTPAGIFSDNHAIAYGLNMGYSF